MSCRESARTVRPEWFDRPITTKTTFRVIKYAVLLFTVYSIHVPNFFVLHPGSISPAVMIPDHRLAVLLDHVKQNQINQCLYHNTATAPSLYSDHLCDRSQFPLRTSFELSQHTDEVWYLEFSHDGTKLATTSRDCSVIIYDASTFNILHKLTDHTDPVAYAT